jgi:hypothetical protein
MGVAGLFWWLNREISNDNVLSAEIKNANTEAYQVIGREAVELPWVDSLKNLDPENNGDKRIKKWNFRKVQIRGYFQNKAIVGRIVNKNIFLL